MSVISGYGYGYGYGDGYGDGYGYGYGDGDGSGDGSGYGSGYGDGYGYGYGYGDGYGYGYGDGTQWPVIAGYDATLLPAWRLLKIGCEIHSTDAWRKTWCQIAATHHVEATAELEAQIMAACDAAEEI